MSFTAKQRKSNRLENKRSSNSNKNNQEEDLKQKKKTQNQKSMRAKRRQTKTRVEKTGLSIDDVKKIDNLFLKGPASFGNAKRLQNLSKLSMKKENVSGNETILHQISFTSPQISKA